MKMMISRSFLKGFTRAAGIIGTKEWPDIYNSTMKDYLAIRKDWEAVGNSITEEYRKYAETRK